MQRCIFIFFVLISLFCCSIASAANGSKASYIGGTVSQLPPNCDGAVDSMDQDFFVFWTGKTNLRIAYTQINLLEYGQRVSRRVALAVVISPMLILAKRRKHFLTLGYQDEVGKQQAMVFEVSKSDIRTVLVSLEARTGLKVQFQDEDARRGGKD